MTRQKGKQPQKRASPCCPPGHLNLEGGARGGWGWGNHSAHPERPRDPAERVTALCPGTCPHPGWQEGLRRAGRAVLLVRHWRPWASEKSPAPPASQQRPAGSERSSDAPILQARHRRAASQRSRHLSTALRTHAHAPTPFGPAPRSPRERTGQPRLTEGAGGPGSPHSSAAQLRAGRRHSHAVSRSVPWPCGESHAGSRSQTDLRQGPSAPRAGLRARTRGPVAPGLTPATAAHLSSVRSRFRGPVSPQPPPGACAGDFGGGFLSVTVSYGVSSLLIVSIFLFSFSTDTKGFFSVQVF